jgi:hypothetical protein
MLFLYLIAEYVSPVNVSVNFDSDKKKELMVYLEFESSCFMGSNSQP